MRILTKRYFPVLLAAFLAGCSMACMAASRVLFDPPPTPVPPSTLIPTRLPLTPTPIPSLTPTPDACPDGNCISACVRQLDAIAQPQMTGKGIKAAHRIVGSGYGFILVTYEVDGDRIASPLDNTGIPDNLETYQQDRSSQRKIWDYFTALIPAERRSFVTEYNIFTDGKQNILAAVFQSENDLENWGLMVDITDVTDPQDLTYTLIHEYGHLLTLNPMQVTPSQPIFDHPNDEDIYQDEVDACARYFVGEGCSLPDAYINLFFDRFWPSIYDEWAEIDAIENESRYYSELEKFYKKHKNQFVSDYAPTNPAEDIAESFSVFIMKPKPTGNSIANQKVKFFYDFPELVQLRRQIAERLCAQIEK